MDLDIGWGHRLFGFDDQSDLIAGATVRWLVGFLGMELLGPLGSETLMLFVFGGGKGKKGVFEEMGMVSNIVCCECWMPKTVTLDVFEADSSVGFFIHSFCSKGAFFVRRTGMFIYSYSDHVIPPRNGWMV